MTLTPGEYDDGFGPSIYDFLPMFNSNIWPHWAHLWDIRLQNLSDFEFDSSRSLKVNSLYTL